LTGLITNGRVGTQPANFIWDPELAARGTCYELVDTLRTFCRQGNFVADPQGDLRRMNCVADVLGQDNQDNEDNHENRSELWVIAEKAAQGGAAFPNFTPQATFEQHRSVITYLHYWTCDGRGFETRLPLMQGYFTSITAEVNNGLDQGRRRMEHFKSYLIYSLGKRQSNHAHSIWLVDTMWKNLDAVFPGCIWTARNFGEADPGLDEAKDAFVDMPFGGRRKRRKRTRRKKKRKRKKTRRKRKKRKKTKRRKKRTRRK